MSLLGKMTVATLCLSAVSACALVVSYAKVEEYVSEPTYVRAAPEPTIEAASYLVFDVESGERLIEQNADAQLPIASITKLFTAAAIDGAPLQAATTSITWSDVSAEGRAGKLAYGEAYAARDLLFPLLLESSNDAAAVLERLTGGSIISTLNEAARAAGAANTAFADASGLSDQNLSTAADLALLGSNLYRAHPSVIDITRLDTYIGEHTGWANNNPVAREAGFSGGKHGYTYAANRTVLAFFREPVSAEERTLGYVVLGSDNLARDVAALRSFVAEHVRYE